MTFINFVWWVIAIAISAAIVNNSKIPNIHMLWIIPFVFLIMTFVWIVTKAFIVPALIALALCGVYFYFKSVKVS